MEQAVSPIQSALYSASQLAGTGQSAMGAGTGQSMPGGGQRERFAMDEMAIVLSHYDLGVIKSIVEFPRGSRKAPKALIEAQEGKFLLKRRARGKDDPSRVAFTHGLQLYLADRGFPIAHLVGTKEDNNSMVQLPSGVYELFEYIAGQPYPSSMEAAFDAGKVLGNFHKLAADYQSPWQPPMGSYHAQSSIEQCSRQILQTLGSTDPLLAELMPELAEAYRTAAENAEKQGLSGWPKQYIHADWHPGNMLFKENHIAAVIDFDSARQLPRIIDIANGALQFSIIGSGDDVAIWPDYLDETRFKRFIRGYDGVMLLSEAEVRALPWLMIEALIAEAVVPIAITGSFGRLQGSAFLRMIQRKSRWIFNSAEALVSLLEM